MARTLAVGLAAMGLLGGCGASPLAVASPRAATAAVAQGWGSPLIPTLETLGAPGLDYLSPGAQSQASAYVASHRAAFTQGLASAPAETQAAVAKLHALVAGDALAEAALFQLFQANRLGDTPRSTPAAGGPSVLMSLTAMASAPLGAGIDRPSLVREALDELAVPGRAFQGLKMTCEATSVQIMLATRDPAEYARLVAGLASAEGHVALANGDGIARVPDWDSATDGWRRIPGRLLQPAFAVYGNGPLGYSNSADANSRGKSGLTDPQMATLCSAVFATPFVFLARENSNEGQRMAARHAAHAAGWQTPVWVDLFSGHVVLATDEQAGREIVDNPFGGTLNSVTFAPFAHILHSVYVPATFAPTAAHRR